MTKKRWVRIGFGVAALVVIVPFVAKLIHNYQTEINLLLHYQPGSQAELLAMIRSHGFENKVILFILDTLCVAVPGMSNGVFAILNGVLFGKAVGFLINWLASCLGQLLLIGVLYRLYDAKQFQNQKLVKLLKRQKYPLLWLTLCYMVPFIPSATVAYANIILVKSRVKQLIPICLGMIPFAFLYAYGGDSLLKIDASSAIWVIGGILVVAIGGWIFLELKKHRESFKQI
ncbi:TVP38/TMEM64 family protein [Lactobacillus corticis]|uniref:VTT domain-containing protein n=1 Tax=Lactobacillus corticis TaxID=2201249 RepID=A0A916QF91_9LACO|nr:VTT domain-containing protein [Lactobacillus corticis]GFZ26209.1 hypothetical protein LCB40_00890 [Lactobacillus corticis]